MILGIIGSLIGAMVAGAGLYYLLKEKSDPESRRIYTVVTIAGVVIFAGMLAKLLFSLG